MIRVMLFDRFDQPLGELSENEVFGLVRTERINGEHSLKITTTRVLEKGQRILTCDARGKWREHVVYGTDALHDSGERPFGEYYCVWSVQHDLVGTRISSMPGVQNPVTAAVALAAALAGTARWANGTVTNTNTGGASMYDTDGWSGLSTLVNVWGGEIDTTIEVGSTGVMARKVDLYAMQGDQDAKRRFDFGADIKSVRRKMDDGALYCRITPRGMGEESGEGWGRKITIESVNDGKDYLENEDMVPIAKLPDGHGGFEYPTLEVENSDCTTPQELLDWALSVLEYYTVPRITYTVDVLQLAKEGVDMHGVSLGDAVQIVDRKFGNGLRTSGRVMQTVVNMLDEADMQVTVGSIGNDIADVIASMETRLATMTDTLNYIAGGMGADDYYSTLLAHLNAQINATGGYSYLTEGEGIRVYDTAVTDPKVGAEASAAVEIKGGTIRIADSKTAQGQWNWRTVFVSGLVASDVLSASNITTGALRVENASHEAVFIADMDAGTVQMAGDSIVIGQKTLNDVANVVYGTFYVDRRWDEVHQYYVVENYGGDTPQFVLTDDTVLKLKWLEDTNNWPGGSNWWFKLNGTRASQYYGGRLQIPEGFRIERNQLMVLVVDYYDAENPTRWRWLATGAENAAQSTDLSERDRFARDTSSVEINSGKVTFNAGTFVVNAADFKVDEDGVITATAGTIGGMHIAQNHIYNDALDLYGQGLDFLYDEDIFGRIQPQYLVDQHGNIYGLINQQVPGSYHFLSKIPNASGNPDLVYSYSRDHAEVIGTETYTNAKGGFDMYGDVSIIGDAFFKGGVWVGGENFGAAFANAWTGSIKYKSDQGTNRIMTVANGLITGDYPM